jgi:hypothetical protein
MRGREEVATEWTSTMAMDLKTRNDQKNKVPFLVHQMLKWFYDTSIGPARGAIYCGSLFGKGFGLLVVSSG